MSQGIVLQLPNVVGKRLTTGKEYYFDLSVLKVVFKVKFSGKLLFYTDRECIMHVRRQFGLDIVT